MARSRQTEPNDALSEPLLIPASNNSNDDGNVIPNSTIIDDHNRPSEQPSLSRNVKYALIYTWFAFAGRSIWNQSVLATYIYLLKKDNPEAVGYITAVMGMTQLCASFPTGWIIDKHRRDTMLKLGSVIGMVAVMATLGALYVTSFRVLTFALAVWGILWGVANTSLSALFADSTRDGEERTRYFTHRSVILTLGNTTGPLIALLMFYFLGDQWTVRDCAIVMAVGQLICLPAIGLLCFFNDDDVVVVAAEDPALGGASSTEDEETAPETPNNENLLVETGDNSNNDRNPDDETQQRDDLVWCRCLPQSRLLPVLIASGDVAGGLAAGMSIRYFPIFFVDNLRLNPIVVQVLFLLAPLGQVVLMKTAQAMAKSFGRCQMHVAHKWIGVLVLVFMVLSYVYGLPTWLICALYVIRTAFMNSTGALTKSILMDAVPRHERGKWSALESVNMFSWCGSAAIGGLLVKYEGIIFNFCITATFQFLATLPVLAASSLDANENTCQTSIEESTPQQSCATISSEQQSNASSTEEDDDDVSSNTLNDQNNNETG